MIITGKTQINPTHHISLSDGFTTVGLVMVDGYGNPDARNFQNDNLGQPLKLQQGEYRYSDTMPPWELYEIKDFGGGMGVRDMDRDKSRYHWGIRAHTLNGKFMIGGFPSWHVGSYGGYYTWPSRFDEYKYVELFSTDKLALKFTAATTTAIKTVHFIATNYFLYKAGIYDDDGGKPGNLQGTDGQSNDHVIGEIIINIDSGALTQGNPYWVVIEWESSMLPLPGKIICHNASGVTNVLKNKIVSGNETWDSVTDKRPFVILGFTDKNVKRFFAELKGSLFIAYDREDATYIAINGDQGIVKTGATTTSVTSKSGFATWNANEAVGSIFIIMAGTGSTQPRNARTITANKKTDGSGETTYTFTDPWDVAPDATSEFAIVATNKLTFFTPDTGGGTNPWSGKRITDMLSVNNAIYFAHGDNDKMTRFRTFESGGTWQMEWHVESDDSKYSLLSINTDTRGTFIYGAKAGNPSNLCKASALDCSGNSGVASLTWGTPMQIGGTESRITKILPYGDEFMKMYVLKEDGLYSIGYDNLGDDYVNKVAISGFISTKDWRNGRAAVVHDAYLYMNWHDTVMRYRDNFNDNIGLNNSELSVPSEYRGIITKLVTYPGMLICATDAGKNGYSTVNAYNGVGWCNLFTAPAKGMSIDNLYVQAVPGRSIHRLWISCGWDNVWIPISTNPSEQPIETYNNYIQAWSGELTLGRIYGGRQMSDKYFNNFKFYASQRNIYNPSVPAWYVNYRDSLINIGKSKPYNGWFDSTLMEPQDIKLGIVAKGAMPTITMIMYNPYSYISIEAMMYEMIAVDQPNRVTTLTVRVADRDKNLMGEYDDMLTVAEKINKLEEWETKPEKLTMNSNVSIMDNKQVIIQRGSIRLLGIEKEHLNNAYIMQLQVYEV